MSYTAPYIDSSGLHLPSYIDILDDMREQARSIFGPDIYLAEDTQDYQLISIISYKIYDVFKAVEAVYNNRSPATAIGAALDGVVKINGIVRKEAQYSKCRVRLTGEPGTIIKNGVISDKSKNKWSLPDIVIPEAGFIYAMATAQMAGAVYAYKGDIDTIETVTQGWKAVINEEAAEVGIETETDALLRSRQSISTAQPSRTVLNGTIGAVAAVKNIKRYKVYENDTSETDENTIPPHSICVVAEEGDDEEIAKAIYLHKTPGCGTYGKQYITINDTNFVTSTQIHFDRPEYVNLEATVTLKKLKGYTSETENCIKNAMSEYCNNFSIGTDLTTSALWGVIFSASGNMYEPAFSVLSVTVGIAAGEETSGSIPVSYKQVVKLLSENIQIAYV